MFHYSEKCQDYTRLMDPLPAWGQEPFVSWDVAFPPIHYCPIHTATIASSEGHSFQ